MTCYPALRPQTSGGLLAAVPADRVSAVRAALEDQDVPSWEIGEVLEGRGIGVVCPFGSGSSKPRAIRAIFRAFC